MLICWFQIIIDISNSTPLKLTSSDRARHQPRGVQPQLRRAGDNFAKNLRTAFLNKSFARNFFGANILSLNFFWRKIIGSNALIKWWWPWPQVIISPTYYEQLFRTNIIWEVFLCLHSRFVLLFFRIATVRIKDIERIWLFNSQWTIA